MSSSEIYKILQPELMTEEELRKHITDRFIRLQNLNEMTKEQLVEVFHRIITPMHERDNPRKRNNKVNEMKKVKLEQSSDNKNNKKIKVSETRNSQKRENINDDKEFEPAAKKVHRRIRWP